jgi:hypothetical protein
MKEQKVKLEGEISYSKIAQAIGRALIDPDFREVLLENPERVGKKLGFNEEGLKVIKSLDREILDNFTATLGSKLLKDAAIVIFCG